MRLAAFLLLATILLAGCNGGTIDLHALSNDSASIDSLACEGALLANEVAGGDSLGSFTRVHAGELGKRASNFEDALSERPTTPGIERATRKEAEKAGRIAALLEELTTADSQDAARLKSRLDSEGDCP